MMATIQQNSSRAMLMMAMLLSLAARLMAGDSADGVDYNRDIRPILSDRCYACHGPDATKRQAGLRLDHEVDALRALESGEFAIVAHKPDESLLVKRIETADADTRMPPPEAGPPLKSAQIAKIRQWIAAGAKWQGHWSYLKVERPKIPAVSNAAWARNPIDHFVLARLDEEGLKPAAEADKCALLRRATIDLTGLPPTVSEIDAFLADRGELAYERAVDRLLASPHYGERMAMKWLDLARYADTNGYHVDDHRNIWKFREWVIDAFNRNMPFDRFTIEQIAGDLLPGATVEQRIASGFHRNVMVTSEGGADPEEYLTKYAGDRVTTTATVWLGTTLACAECHDHKYDPFTQRDYYRLYAYFNNIGEMGLDNRQGSPVPNLQIPTAEQSAQLARYQQQTTELDARIKREVAAAKIEPPGAPGMEQAQPEQEYVWVDDALPRQALADGSEREQSWHWAASPQPVLSGQLASERTASGFSQHFFINAKDRLTIAEGDRLFAHVFLDPANPPQTVMLQFNDGTWEHRAYWGANTIEAGTDGTPSRLAMGPLVPTGRWVRLEVDAKALGLAVGGTVTGMACSQFAGHVYWDRAGVVNRTPQAAKSFDSQLAWELAEKAKPKSKLPQNVQDAFKAAADRRSDDQRAAIRDYFVRFVYSKTREQFDPLNRQLEELGKAEGELNRAVPITMVMQENPQMRETFVLVRGDFRSKGDRVTRGVPASLPALPPGAPDNRLGLAQWLVDPGNPLVARVMVNRYWQQYFGTGLVKTSDDFGSRGGWPSHAELLDWLASEFVASGWNMKALQRWIVTSATYRQSSKVDPALWEHDPENRLLARGPRFRLDAEMIRDTALAASGLLNPKLGGPSVSPYQPPGLWDELTSGDRYTQSKGTDLYRRGMYVYWKRSIPYPPLVTFDAPNREVCTDCRARTNTPLQALVLLNDPAYVEAARVLGQRIMREGGADITARLTFAFRLCTSRPPTDNELSVLRAIYDANLAKYRQNPQAAAKLIAIGESARPADLDSTELAAWTTVGNVLLNLDETITKG
ncbi:MAG TPA: PSD1 and planctomycete cytochrome C domain-containing protein [Pirellulales bacterium]|nr:PSD1 and planctomycete cytochrome C domain-containing protein [Pirellulales bacterium]